MLEIDSLSYSQNRHTLLKDISARLSPGKIYGLIGPNGSGKTTFLKNIAGIWKPTQGRVLWHGRPLHHGTRKEISRWVTFVPHTTISAFDFTVEEIILMGDYVEEHSVTSDKKKNLERILGEVDIADLIDRPMTYLSQGERQRVLLARALYTQAPLLLLDEPFASLDLRHRLRIASLLKQLAETGHLIILALHDFTLARELCDEVILLHKGRCVGSGPFEEILSLEKFEEIFGVIPLSQHQTNFTLSSKRVVEMK